jgi:phosphatidylserine decarboxylase
MRIDPAGWPFVAGAAGAALLFWVIGYPLLAAVLGVAAGFLLFFFRDPDRPVDAQPTDVLSPADGRVVVAGPADPQSSPAGNWLQVSIFLSPMDVHVNRIPVSGVIKRVDYRPGKFLPAYRPDAASDNERTEVWLDHDGQTIVFRQVVGILARRIVCRVKAGARVDTGARFGVMKFGSRMDVFLPPDAALRVTAGDRVLAAVTVIATLASRRAES